MHILPEVPSHRKTKAKKTTLESVSSVYITFAVSTHVMHLHHADRIHQDACVWVAIPLFCMVACTSFLPDFLIVGNVTLDRFCDIFPWLR